MSKNFVPQPNGSQIGWPAGSCCCLVPLISSCASLEITNPSPTLVNVPRVYEGSIQLWTESHIGTLFPNDQEINEIVQRPEIVWRPADATSADGGRNVSGLGYLHHSHYNVLRTVDWIYCKNLLFNNQPVVFDEPGVILCLARTDTGANNGVYVSERNFHAAIYDKTSNTIKDAPGVWMDNQRAVPEACGNFIICYSSQTGASLRLFLDGDLLLEKSWCPSSDKTILAGSENTCLMSSYDYLNRSTRVGIAFNKNGQVWEGGFTGIPTSGALTQWHDCRWGLLMITPTCLITDELAGRNIPVPLIIVAEEGAARNENCYRRYTTSGIDYQIFWPTPGTAIAYRLGKQIWEGPLGTDATITFIRTSPDSPKEIGLAFSSVTGNNSVVFIGDDTVYQGSQRLSVRNRTFWNVVAALPSSSPMAWFSGEVVYDGGNHPLVRGRYHNGRYSWIRHYEWEQATTCDTLYYNDIEITGHFRATNIQFLGDERYALVVGQFYEWDAEKNDGNGGYTEESVYKHFLFYDGNLVYELENPVAWDALLLYDYDDLAIVRKDSQWTIFKNGLELHTINPADTSFGFWEGVFLNRVSSGTCIVGNLETGEILHDGHATGLQWYGRYLLIQWNGGSKVIYGGEIIFENNATNTSVRYNNDTRIFALTWGNGVARFYEGQTWNNTQGYSGTLNYDAGELVSTRHWLVCKGNAAPYTLEFYYKDTLLFTEQVGSARLMTNTPDATVLSYILPGMGGNTTQNMLARSYVKDVLIATGTLYDVYQQYYNGFKNIVADSPTQTVLVSGSHDNLSYYEDGQFVKKWYARTDPDHDDADKIDLVYFYRSYTAMCNRVSNKTDLYWKGRLVQSLNGTIGQEITPSDGYYINWHDENFRSPYGTSVPERFILSPQTTGKVAVFWNGEKLYEGDGGNAGHAPLFDIPPKTPFAIGLEGAPHLSYSLIRTGNSAESPPKLFYFGKEINVPEGYWQQEKGFVRPPYQGGPYSDLYLDDQVMVFERIGSVDDTCLALTNGTHTIYRHYKRGELIRELDSGHKDGLILWYGGYEIKQTGDRYTGYVLTLSYEGKTLNTFTLLQTANPNAPKTYPYDTINFVSSYISGVVGASLLITITTTYKPMPVDQTDNSIISVQKTFLYLNGEVFLESSRWRTISTFIGKDMETTNDVMVGWWVLTEMTYDNTWVAPRLYKLYFRDKFIEESYDPYDLYSIGSSLLHAPYVWCSNKSQGVRLMFMDKWADAPPFPELVGQPASYDWISFGDFPDWPSADMFFDKISYGLFTRIWRVGGGMMSEYRYAFAVYYKEVLLFSSTISIPSLTSDVNRTYRFWSTGKYAIILAPDPDYQSLAKRKRNVKIYYDGEKILDKDCEAVMTKRATSLSTLAYEFNYGMCGLKRWFIQDTEHTVIVVDEEFGMMRFDGHFQRIG